MIVVAAPPALAHVTVDAPGVVPGSIDGAITFRVPTESATASTVEVKVQLPTDAPIAGVLVVEKPGWTATLTRTSLPKPLETDDGPVTTVVSVIDWKSSGASTGIAPGYLGEFTFVAGQVPDSPTLTFKAIQTYSDGSSTSWVQVAAPGSTTEPEDPAPVLHLAAADASVGPTAVRTDSDEAANTAGADAGHSRSGPISLVLSLVALGVAIAVLALLLFERVRGKTMKVAR